MGADGWQAVPYDRCLLGKGFIKVMCVGRFIEVLKHWRFSRSFTTFPGHH